MVFGVCPLCRSFALIFSRYRGDTANTISEETEFGNTKKKQNGFGFLSNIPISFQIKDQSQEILELQKERKREKRKVAQDKIKPLKIFSQSPQTSIVLKLIWYRCVLVCSFRLGNWVLGFSHALLYIQSLYLTFCDRQYIKAVSHFT